MLGYWLYMMGKKIENGDYATPLFTRLHRIDRERMSDIIKSYPEIPVIAPREDRPATRKIRKNEIIKIAIAELHKKRCKNKK